MTGKQKELYTVAIALSPATPAPIISTLQGGIYEVFSNWLVVFVYL